MPWRRLPDPLVDADMDGVARLLADRFTDVSLYRQLVRAIAHGHKRAAEWTAVNRASDLSRPPSPKNWTESGIAT